MGMEIGVVKVVSWATEPEEPSTPMIEEMGLFDKDVAYLTLTEIHGAADRSINRIRGTAPPSYLEEVKASNYAFEKMCVEIWDSLGLPPNYGLPILSP